jgi:hypothetical protein
VNPADVPTQTATGLQRDGSPAHNPLSLRKILQYNREKTSEALSRIFANLLLWTAFAGVVELAPVLTDAATSVLPDQAILKYVDAFFWYQVAAAVIVLGMFVLLKFLSNDHAEANRAWYHALRGVEEWGGMLINFGSFSSSPGLRSATVLALAWRTRSLRGSIRPHFQALR